MLLAKRLTLLKRTDPRPPTPTQWICNDLFFIKLEEIKQEAHLTSLSNIQASVSMSDWILVLAFVFLFFQLNTIIIIIIIIIILIVSFHCFLKPHFFNILM